MNNQTKMAKFKKAYRKKWKHVIYIMPILIWWFIIAIYPRLEIFPMSLYEWNPVTNHKEFVGLYYFKLMFTRSLDYTLRDTWNTCMYVFYLFIIQTTLAFILSLALQKNTKHNNFFRALFFLPLVFSTSMVSLTWAYMYDPNVGIINNILAIFQPDKYPGFSYFTENWMAILVVVIVHIWANIGYTITILTSGLNTISEDLGEAAQIDGANRWQTFWHITVPLMLPTILRNTLLTISTGATASDYQFLLGNRSQIVEYDTWATLLYKNLTMATDYGPVCAMSVVFFVVLSVLAIIQFVAMKKVEDKILG